MEVVAVQVKQNSGGSQGWWFDSRLLLLLELNPDFAPVWQRAGRPQDVSVTSLGSDKCNHITLMSNVSVGNTSSLSLSLSLSLSVRGRCEGGASPWRPCRGAGPVCPPVSVGGGWPTSALRWAEVRGHGGGPEDFLCHSLMRSVFQYNVKSPVKRRSGIFPRLLSVDSQTERHNPRRWQTDRQTEANSFHLLPVFVLS